MYFISKEPKGFLDVSPSRWAFLIAEVLAFSVVVRGQICLVADAFLELFRPFLISLAANWNSNRVPELPGVLWAFTFASIFVVDETVDAIGIDAAEECSIRRHHLALAVWAAAAIVKRLE